MSGTKVINIPDPITFGREQFSYYELVDFLLDNHPHYISSGEAIRRASRTERAFGLDGPREERPKQVKLLEDDHRKLLDAMEKPPSTNCARCGNPLGFGGYPVPKPRKLEPFLEATKNATEE